MSDRKGGDRYLGDQKSQKEQYEQPSSWPRLRYFCGSRASAPPFVGHFFATALSDPRSFTGLNRLGGSNPSPAIPGGHSGVSVVSEASTT